MIIEYKDFEEFIKDTVSGLEEDYIFVSPGNYGPRHGVSRATVYNWINKDVIDVLSYKGEAGTYVYICSSEDEKVRKYKEEYGKYEPIKQQRKY